MTPLTAAGTAPSRCASAGSSWRKWHRQAAPSAAGEHPAAAVGATATSIRAARLSGSAGPPRLTAPAGTARLLHDVEERPLVVMVPSLIETNRFLFALAHHAHQAARNGAAESSARGRRPGAKASRGRTAATGLRAARLPATDAAAADRLPTLAGDAAACRNRDEVVARDRIFEFLADVAPLDQDVDARRKRLGLRLVEPNRPDVLLAAEDELGFLFALRLMTPHGHGDGHQHRHHGERDEQRRHRVPFLAGLTP